MARRADPTTLLGSVLGPGSPPGLTDGELVERFAFAPGAAREAAFAALVDRHSRMVYRTCRGILRDDHEAMDATQATFLILFRKGASVRVVGSLGPWLHRVACRAALRARLEAGRRRAIEHHLRAAHRPAPPGAGDRLDALHEELDRLPERFRVPIILCDLEGHTCASAADQVGCPVGTLASRLARGRARLRGRLTRRGLDPATGTLAPPLPRESAAIPPPAAPRVAAASPAIDRLSRDVIRSLAMDQLKSIGIAAACGLGLLAGWNYRGTHAQDPAPATRPRPVEPTAPDPGRYQDYAFAALKLDREAILDKDGTAKLWTLTGKEPVAPPLRHEQPIRALTFFDEVNLLATVSDDEVRLWDGQTGELRSSLPGQIISPPWSNLCASKGHFLTLDPARMVVTVRDWTTLGVVATLRPTAEVSAAVLAPDGRTVAAFRLGDAPTAEFWDVASGRPFATIRPPSAALEGIVIEAGSKLDRSALAEPDAAFWGVAHALAPKSLGR